MHTVHTSDMHQYNTKLQTQGSLQCAHVNQLSSGVLQQLADLLQLCVLHCMVVDLGGRTFKGPLRGSTPHRLVLSHAGTVIRNGTLQLPGNACVVVTAPGCHLDSVAIKGQGITGALMLTAGCS